MSVTLKEFILELNKNQQFRVFQPNNDCLIYESFHFPHVTDSGVLSAIWGEDYYTLKKTQSYCPVIPRVNINALDYETKIFLETFGDYKVFSVDASSCFKNAVIYDDELDKWQVVNCSEIPGDTESCLDIYIIKD